MLDGGGGGGDGGEVGSGGFVGGVDVEAANKKTKTKTTNENIELLGGHFQRSRPRFQLRLLLHPQSIHSKIVSQPSRDFPLGGCSRAHLAHGEIMMMRRMMMIMMTMMMMTILTYR